MRKYFDGCTKFGLAIASAFSLCACSQGATEKPDHDFSSLQMQGIERVSIDVDADMAAKRLAKAIQFRTISNQDRSDFDIEAFEGYHDYLEETYPRVHATLKRELIGDPRPYSLLYTWEGSDPSLPPVVLMAHQDVVPVPDDSRDQWKQDPFAGVIADGYIWGRGVLDDKCQIHGILEAAEKRIGEGFVPTRTIYFVFGHDEEVGGPEGARAAADLLEARGIKEIAFVFDESAPLIEGVFPGLEGNSALIGIAQKGFVSLELRIDGVGGHSSQPPLQSNIGIVSQAVNKLEAAQFPYVINDAVRYQYRFMGPEMAEEKHEMYAAVAFGDGPEPSALEKTFIDEMAQSPITRAMLHTTIATTMFNAGVKDNVLPPSAAAVVNFRIAPGEDQASVIEYVRQAIEDPRIVITDISASTPPTAIADPFGPGYKLVEKTIRQTWGNDLVVSPFFVIGGSDSKHFQARPFAPNVYTFTGIQLDSPEEFAGFHGVNERILVDEYAKTIGFFYLMIGNFEEM